MSGDDEKENLSPEEQAYYGALLGAWFAIRMERDRTLLGLSAGGAALLAGVLSGFDVKYGWLIVLSLLAALCFLGAILAGLLILRRNSSHLEVEKDALFAGKGPTGKDQELERLDWWQERAFFGGAVLTMLVALISSVISPTGLEVSVPEKSTTAVTPRSINLEQKDSLSGTSAMRPGTSGTSGSTGGAAGSGDSPGTTGGTSSAPPPAASGGQTSNQGD